MQNIWLDPDKCISCRQCVAICPHQCLSICAACNDHTGLRPVYLRRPDRCSGCEMCVAACPAGAIEGYK